MLNALGILLLFILFMYYFALPILDYCKGTLFSQVVRNKKAREKKALKVIEKKIKSRIKDIVKNGEFKTEITVDELKPSGITQENIQEFIENEYGGDVQLVKFSKGYGGYYFCLEIVKQQI